MDYVKHLVECNCTLPQFKYRSDIIFHKFTVLSVIDDSDHVIPKLVKCQNCGVIHNVIDLCKSEIVLNKEDSNSLITIDDVKASLSSKIAGVLESYKVDQATWEETKFIVDNGLWGKTVTLSHDDFNGEIHVKKMVVLGEAMMKIESFSNKSLLTEIGK